MSNTQKLVDQIWRTFDTDHSGVLERDEAQRFIKQICSPQSGLEHFKTQIMEILDLNGDGQLTKNEVMQLFEDDQVIY